ncbi:hypothetical protein AXG93_857s1230 [Marchantia polymorpha subsp. ruderalis]|uniref:Uncharacterized protein n=1 Tax=Marchantia polymorpha subsp. ruderalis TaxID=1480154 RepID=A0A176WCB3_MARPO|nr:hypothetical protein AXG93_857s1230 [Marchantia polymorpha subsp. ruderalis]
MCGKAEEVVVVVGGVLTMIPPLNLEAGLVIPSVRVHVAIFGGAPPPNPFQRMAGSLQTDECVPRTIAKKRSETAVLFHRDRTSRWYGTYRIWLPPLREADCGAVTRPGRTALQQRTELKSLRSPKVMFYRDGVGLRRGFPSNDGQQPVEDGGCRSFRDGEGASVDLSGLLCWPYVGEVG